MSWLVKRMRRRRPRSAPPWPTMSQVFCPKCGQFYMLQVGKRLYRRLVKQCFSWPHIDCLPCGDAAATGRARNPERRVV